MKFRSLSTILVWSLVTTAPLPAQTGTTFKVATPLYGLAPREELVLRVVDAQRGGASARIVAVFVNERNEVVGNASGVLSPQALTIRLPYSALGSSDPFPAVRGIFTFVLSGDGSGHQVLLNMEFFDVETFRARGGVTCAQKPPDPGGRVFNCGGPVADI